MTVYLDASALVALHLEAPQRQVAAAAVAADTDWCSSALTLMESLALVDRVLDSPGSRDELEDLIRLTWDRIAIVPLDQQCLDRATTLMRAQPLRLSDALHLAAADRLPRPVRFVTFDAAQIPVAMGLGFEILSS